MVFGGRFSGGKGAGAWPWEEQTVAEAGSGLGSSILVVAPSWIGDMVMAQSLLKRLRSRDPSCRITVFAPAWCQGLLERMPEITGVIPNPFGHGQLRLAGRMRCAREIRERHFDLALILPHSLKSALIPALARIPRRRGWLGEQRFVLLNQIYRHEKSLPLMVQRYNALAFAPAEISDVSRQACPEPVLISYPEKAGEILSRLGMEPSAPETGILGLCPGAEYGPAKRWPCVSFAALAASWIRRGGGVRIFGSAKDTPAAAEIREHLPEDLRGSCQDLTGRTTLPEAVDLLSACRAVVTNDSGLMHVSAAVGVPLVAIYGSSTTDYTPPLTSRARTVFMPDLDCRPCFKRECPRGTTECLTGITPARVEQELDELLRDAAGTEPGR